MADKHLQAVGLDAGSTRTRAVVCLIENGRIRCIGAAETPAQGWVKGRINDQNALTESLSAAFGEAERSAQLPVEGAVVGIGGSTVRGGNSRSSLELGRPREVEQRDVNRLVDRASRVQLAEDRMVLQCFTQDFVVDDHPGHRDPRRMLGYKLEVNVHLITVSSMEHTALVSAVNQAHLGVEETVYEALASCLACVLPEERREGIAVLDIGAHSSEMVVYYGDSLQLAATLPICADHFARDVARGLCISYEDAVLVKEEYGSALEMSASPNSLVELPAPDDREPREAPRRVLNAILEARAEELFLLVRSDLERIGMARALAGGIVLTGGGAKLAGMCDVAERILNCQARNGLAVGIRDWPAEFEDPRWTTAAGLAMYAGRLKLQGESERHAVPLLGRMLKI